MADASETKYCSNCKRDIAVANFLMHEVHCRRNIVLCDTCAEPVPRSELDSHFDEYHAKEECSLCKSQIEKCKLEDHKSLCPKRPVQCEFCELDLPFSDLESHRNYCGTRTEQCYKCGQYVMQKDQVKHDDTNCTYPETKQKQRSTPQRSPGEMDYDVPQQYYNSFAMDELSRILDTVPSVVPGIERGLSQTRASGPRNLRPAANERPHYYHGNDLPANFTRNSQNKRNGNQKDGKTKNTNRQAQRTAANRPSSLLEGEGMDHMLAMHLAHDLSQDGESPYYESRGPMSRSADSTPANGVMAEDILLPCEICNELLPVNALLLHQGMCTGDTSLADNDSPPSPPPTTVGMSRLPREPQPMVLPNNSPSRNTPRSQAQPHIVDNLSYLAAHDWLSGPVNGEDGEVHLPCEFCDALYPEELLVQHQAVCEANTSMTPRIQSPLRPSGLSHVRPKARTSAIGAASTHTEYRSRSRRHHADPTLDFQNNTEESGASGSSRTDHKAPRRRVTSKNKKANATYSKVNLSKDKSRSHVTVSVKDNRYTGAASSEEEEEQVLTDRRRRGSAAKVRQTLDQLLEDPTYSTQDIIAFMDKEEESNLSRASSRAGRGAGRGAAHKDNSLLDKEEKSKNNQKKKEAAGPSHVSEKRRQGDRVGSSRQPRRRVGWETEDSGATYDPSFAASSRSSTTKKPRIKAKPVPRQTIDGDFDLSRSLRVNPTDQANAADTAPRVSSGYSRKRGNSRPRKHPQGDA